MRISDWSSDVCSSDLHIGPLTVALAETFAPGTTPLGLTPLIDDAPRLTELAHDIVARLRPWDPSLITPELRGLIEKFGDEAIDWLGTTGPVIGPFVDRTSVVWGERVSVLVDQG